MPEESILVTGACGFIGKHLVKTLVDGGFRVTACDLPSADFSWCEDLGVRALAGDLMNREFASKVVQGIDGVFNLAAAFDLSLPVYELVSKNVGIVKNLAEAAARAGVRSFIHFSTCDVFGLKRKGPTHEDDQKKPRCAYSYSKLLSEEAAMRYSSEKGMSISIIRPTFVYGPGAIYTAGAFIALSALLKRYTESIPLPRGGPMINTIHVEDLVRATVIVYEARKKARGLAFNVADDSKMCAFDFLRYIFEPFGITCSRPLRLPWALVEGAARIAGKIPVSFYRRAEAFLQKKWKKIIQEEGLKSALSVKFDRDFLGYVYGDHCYSNERIKSLGWVPKFPTFKDGWSLTVQWYRENGYIP